MMRLRDEDGFSLVELLVAASLMLVVFGAVLTVLEVMQRQSASATVRADSQDQARLAVDRVTRDLRNAVNTPAGLLELNGATEVAKWRVLAGTSAGSLARVATVRKQGFETKVELSSTATTFAVRALDSEGRVIGTSAAIPAS